MATITEPRTRAHDGEQRLLFGYVGWEGYDAMLKIVGTRPIRLTYDRGELEIMTLSQGHERSKTLLSRFIETVTEELDIPCIGLGSTTWRRQDLDRGLEADECYYLANVDRVLGREITLGVDPPPDLAIEIEITRGVLNRLGIYAALGISEIWRFDGQALQFLQLQPDGSYATCERSLSLPFLLPGEVVPILDLAEGLDDSRWGRVVRTWVREELAPRL